MTKRDSYDSIWPKTSRCRVTCDSKALMLFRMQWPKETAMTVQPMSKSCRVTCDCKALLFRTHSDQKRQLWQYGPRQRVTCDSKALMLFRMHSDQKRQLWQYGPIQRVVKLPVTVRPWCCSELEVCPALGERSDWGNRADPPLKVRW